MLDVFIHWFTIGIGLVVGILTAAVGVGLLVTLFIIISILVFNYFYYKYHKGEK